MDKIVKNLGSLFGEDQVKKILVFSIVYVQLAILMIFCQVTLLCGGPVRRCNQWSDKTLAKAFDLRLNCGDRVCIEIFFLL